MDSTASTPTVTDPPQPPPFQGPGAPDPGGLHRLPAPLHGGPRAFWRFARANYMLRPGYLELILRWLYLKARWRGRLATDGLCFVRRGVKFEIGPSGRIELGRWSWVGDHSKLRAHQGVLSIGAKSVLGQEITISCYQRVAIGRECIIADRSMLIDFDHNVDQVEITIRKQGINKHDVTVGNNVWLGYSASILCGVSVGDNAVIGAGAVVTHDVPDNAIVAGVPAHVVKLREPPQALRFE